jgi:hypothetical protein
MGTGTYSSAVNWSVNSTPGGNSTLGTISSSGLYTAPATIATGSANVSVVASSQSSPAITGSASIALSYPSPKITSVAPNAINAGSAATVVTIQGSNFTTASSVYVGTSAISTSFVSSSTLQATIPASSLNLAGALSVDVTNPQPGGGSSASQQVNVVPQLVSVTPTSAPVGGSVALQLTGVDSSNASSVVVSFAQTGQTFTASSGAFTSSGGSPQLTLAVPSGLAPSSALAQFSAPAQISVSVDSVPATATLPFTVQPPTHAGSITPATVVTNLSVQTSLTGVATSFDSTTSITSDDPGITFSGVSANSNTILLATMQVGSGAMVGLHTITVTTQAQSLTYPLQVVSSVAAPTITAVSGSNAAPAGPITITGTGLGTNSSDVELTFSFGSSQAVIPVTAASATEIDSFMPVLFDSTTGNVYSGPATLVVAVNGQASNSFPLTISQLPANTSSIGTTTLAAINAAITNATNAQAAFATPSLLSTDQAASANAYYTALLSTLDQFKTNVAAASAGQTAVNPDGSTLDASTVNLLDRILQSTKVPSSAMENRGNKNRFPDDMSMARPEFLTQDTDFRLAGQFCSANDNTSVFWKYFGYATTVVCAASPFAPEVAGPFCGAMKTFSYAATIVTNVTGVVCNATPITLGKVLASPTSIDASISSAPIIEAPTGTFETSPKLAYSTVQSITDLVLNEIDLPKSVSKLIQSNRVLARAFGDAVAQGIDALNEQLINQAAPSWGLTSQQMIPLTTETTSLAPDPLGLVGTSGLTVTPGAQAGYTNLHFDTSQFRMFDAAGNGTTDVTQVSGNALPVAIGNTTVAVSPSTVTLAPSGTQQFTAMVQGITSTAVSWSVNGVAGGNATVGSISDQGLYTAPATVPNPATVSVTATDPDTKATGTATVTIGGAPPTYFLVGNWAGTATYVQADGNQSVSYSVGVSLSQTATSFTGTFTGLEDSVPQTYTIVGQLAGNAMTFSIASTEDPDTDSAAGTISASGLQVTGSGGESSSGSIVWNGNSQITGSALLEPGAGEDYGSTSWTGSISTDGQHLTGGATAANGDTIRWSLTRQ